MEFTQVEQKPLFDETIEGIEYHSHFPYSSSKFEHGDEIRISVQHQDIYSLPSQSYLYVEGTLTKEDGTPTAIYRLVNNVFGFMFDEIRFELCGIEIERIRNPGINTLLKGISSIRSVKTESSGWTWGDTLDICSPGGHFSICVPLSHVFGFAEDYHKIIINVKQEIILIRNRNDNNCIIKTGQGDERAKLNLTKLCWKLPYVSVNEYRKLSLLKHLKMGKGISIPFRGRELYEYPLLPATQRQVWAVKTSSQLEKPRYVMLAFSTSRLNILEKNASVFDHCSLTNVKLFLNSKSYPYDDLHIDYEKHHYALLYQMLLDFQRSFYAEISPISMISFNDFKSKFPVIVLDCSKQCESIKSGPVDVRLEFEASQPFPENTTAYCLIIHDSLVEYNPLTNVIRKNV